MGVGKVKNAMSIGRLKVDGVSFGGGGFSLRTAFIRMSFGDLSTIPLTG